MPGGGEHAHVAADLSDHHFGGPLCDAGDRGRQCDGGMSGRAQLSLDRVRELVDLLIQEVQVREDRADDQRVVRLEAALQRLTQRRDLRPQLPLGQVGEDLGIGRSLNERVEHRPAGHPEDVGRDAVKLDPGVFQRLVQPVRFTLTLSDLGLAIPGQGPQAALRLRRHEAAAQQPCLHQLAQPFSVLHVGLTTGNVFDVRRVTQRQLEVVLEDVPVGNQYTPVASIATSVTP
jgi:hypothetical protein